MRSPVITDITIVNSAIKPETAATLPLTETARATIIVKAGSPTLAT